MHRTLLTLVMSLVLSASSFAQTTNPAQPFSPEDYRKKSKSQLTAAYIFLGGGTVLAAAGVAIGFGEAVNTIGNIFNPDEVSTSNTGEVLFYTGLVSMAGSVPLFIASSRNKKKAASVSAIFKMEHRSVIQQQSLARASYPALSFQFSF